MCCGSSECVLADFCTFFAYRWISLPAMCLSKHQDNSSVAVCGCAGAAPTQSRQQGGREGVAEDSGYWDLVYLLYPEAVEAAGLGLVHELVSSWPLIERTLAVNHHDAPCFAASPTAPWHRKF